MNNLSLRKNIGLALQIPTPVLYFILLSYGKHLNETVLIYNKSSSSYGHESIASFALVLFLLGFLLYPTRLGRIVGGIVSLLIILNTFWVALAYLTLGHTELAGAFLFNLISLGLLSLIIFIVYVESWNKVFRRIAIALFLFLTIIAINFSQVSARDIVRHNDSDRSSSQNSIQEDLYRYFIDNGHYPGNLTDINNSIKDPVSGNNFSYTGYNTGYLLCLNYQLRPPCVTQMSNQS